MKWVSQPARLVVASTFLVQGSVFAQCEIGQLGINEPQIDDNFGARIALHGDRLAVADLQGSAAGHVHVYGRAAGGWILQEELGPPSPQPGDEFGISIAATQDRIVVGASGREVREFGQGAVYVFHRAAGGAWQLEAELAASDGDLGDRFGYSVAVWDEVIVVGAPLDENGGTFVTGSAYVFRYLEGRWQEQAKVFDAAGATSDGFGVSVAVCNGVAIVGAPGNGLAGPEAGAVFVYRCEGRSWEPEAVVVPPGNPLIDWFGTATALGADGALAFIGAPQHDGQTGAVYVFRRDEGRWLHEITLMAGEPSGPFPFFGVSLALSPSARTLLVGAPYDFAEGFESGAAHLFRREGSSDWKEIAKLTGSDEGAGDYFGGHLALWDDWGAFGAAGENQAGRVYVFAGMSGADCDGNGEPDGCDIFEGILDDKDVDGIPDECETAGDVNGDGSTNVLDLLQVLAAWGLCPGPCPPGCMGDADGDCAVGPADFMAVLLGWH